MHQFFRYIILEIDIFYIKTGEGGGGGVKKIQRRQETT